MLPRIHEQLGQAVQARGHVRVLGAEHLLTNGQGALEERPGLVEPPRAMEQQGQVVQIRGHIGVFGA